MSKESESSKVHFSKEEINNIPVYYCNSCLSLHILRGTTEEIPEFCGKCYSTNISKCHITTWRELYYNRYNIYPENEKN